MYCLLLRDTASPEICTLSLHDALPIFHRVERSARVEVLAARPGGVDAVGAERGRRIAVDRHLEVDRKSTRLNSSHANISYAVFCSIKQNNSRSTRRSPVQRRRTASQLP